MAAITKQGGALMISGATTTTTGDVFDLAVDNSTYQATVTGTGAVSATIEIYVSNDRTHWILGRTITLAGTTTHTDGGGIVLKWNFVRADITAISGTDATVSVSAGA